MSAKYMILGALSEGPSHGYDLKTRFFKKTFSDFGINDGQLYPLLKKLEKEVLIKKDVVAQEGKPSRHRYTITDEGRQDFLVWLESSDGEDRSFRYDFVRKDEFFARCDFLRHLDKRKAVEKMERQIKTVEKTLEDFRAARERMVDKGIDHFRVKIIDYGIKNQQARLEWLEEFLVDIKATKKWKIKNK